MASQPLMSPFDWEKYNARYVAYQKILDWRRDWVVAKKRESENYRDGKKMALHGADTRQSGRSGQGDPVEGDVPQIKRVEVGR